MLPFAVLGLPGGEDRTVDEPEAHSGDGPALREPRCQRSPQPRAEGDAEALLRAVEDLRRQRARARALEYVLRAPAMELERDGTEKAQSTTSLPSSGGRTSRPCAIDARSTFVSTEPDM